MAQLPDNIASFLAVDFSGNVVNVEASLFVTQAGVQQTASADSNIKIPTPVQEEESAKKGTTIINNITETTAEPFLILADSFYVPLVNTDKTNFVNSAIYQNGFKIGINTKSPAFLLDVNAGSINIRNTTSIKNYGYKIDGHSIAYADELNNKIVLGDNTLLSKIDVNTLLISGLINSPATNILRYLTINDAGIVSAVEDVDAARIKVKGRNSTTEILYKGTIVFMSGSTGNRPNFVKARANAESTSARTFGVILDDIAINADGYAVAIGFIDTLDTRNSAAHPFTSDTLLDGDTIYLSPTTAGYVTNVKPSAPNHLVYIGKVTRASPTNGTIIYQIQNGYELDEIHDVAISAKANKDFLYQDGTTSLWKNAQFDSIMTLGGEVSGTYGNMMLVNDAVIAKTLSISFTTSNTDITAGNSILIALGRAQGQINAIKTSITNLSLDSLSDVTITSAANKNFVYYDSATSLWKNGLIDNILTIGGQVSGTYGNMTLVNDAVIAKTLSSSFALLTGTVGAGDSILQAFGRLQNQINGLSGSLIYKGTWNASTNAEGITSGVGTNGWFYIVSVASTTRTIDGITGWAIGDWIIFNGTVWQKIANSAVTSINGLTGVVTLTADDVPEKASPTNKYYTDARVASYLTGAISLILTTQLTADSVLVSNGSGKIIASTVSTTKLGYINGLTSDAQTQINGKEPAITAGTTAQYWRGDKTWQTLPIYTLSGLGGEPAITAGTTAQYWRGDKTWQTLPTYTLSSLGAEPAITAGTTAQYWRGDKTWQTLPIYTLSGLGGEPAITAGTTAQYWRGDKAWATLPVYTLSGLGGEPAISAGTTSQYWRGDKTWQTLPVYTLSGLGGVPSSRTLTINGTGYDLSSDRSWTIAAVTSLASLTDVAITSVADTQLLRYYSSSGKWQNWTPTYISGNQTITLSGDATGSGATSIAVTLANSGVTAGTYTKVTVDAKGRVTAGASLASGDIPSLSYLPLSGGSMAGNIIMNMATSPYSYYLQFGDNTGWIYRFMTNVSGTPTMRFSFKDNGDLTATGTVTSTKFITSGGATTSFVKGDGTLDSTTYFSSSGQVAIASTSGFTIYFDQQLKTTNSPTFAALTVGGITITPLTSSATAGYIPYFSTVSNLANSSFYQDSNGNIGLGTTSPTSNTGYRSITLAGGTVTTGGTFYEARYSSTQYGRWYSENNSVGMNAFESNLYIGIVAGGSYSNVIFGDKTTGYVGIRKTSASYPLDISGDLNISGVFRINGVAQSFGGVSGTGSTNYMAKWSGTGSISAGSIIDTGTSVSVFQQPSVAYVFNVKNFSNKYMSLWTPTLNGVDGIGLLFHNAGGLFDQTPAGINASKIYFSSGISIKMLITSSSVYINRDYDTAGNISGGGALQVNGSVNITGGTFMIDGVSITGGGGGGGAVSSVFGRTGAVSAQYGDYSIYSLANVSISSPTTGQVLYYNGSTWINSTISGGGGVTALSGLSDVAVSGMSTGQVLTWNGSKWVNQASSGGSSGGIGGSGTAGYIALFTGSGTSIGNSSMTQSGSNITVGGSGTITATGFYEFSDKRLKDIISADEDVIRFKWKDGSDNLTHIGYAAQDMIDKYPDQVILGANGYYSVNYTEILVDKVAGLERKVKELEKEIEILKN